MKKKSLKDRLLSLSIISSILIGIASSFVVTYAAIINKFVAPNNLQYAVSGYSAYFNKGSGSNDSPFEITTSDHLRNLQKLNSLGAFNENTYFQLSADITYEGDALLPIGTDDMPFNSKFDGKGHTITNLVVNGANTRDVGMFGYVGINGKVSNMILNHPTINLTANTAGDYNATANGALSTTNYLDSVLKDKATSLSNPKVSSSGLGLSFSDTGTTVTDSNEVSYPINYKSSDESLLAPGDDGISFSVATKNIDETKFTTNLAMVHITASVQSIINNNIMNYTLERFAVTLSLIKGTNSTSIEIKTDNNSKFMVEKTMWYQGTDTSGNPYTDYHETYIGFFIGHCDGGASYLGLYGGTGTSASETANGLIKLSRRKAQSSSCLIGKTRSDNPRDLTAKDQFHKDFNFQEIPSQEKNIQYDTKLTESIVDCSTTDNSAETEKTLQMIETQNQNANEFTNEVLGLIEPTVNNSTTNQYIKLFPSSTISKTKIDNNDTSIMSLNSGISAGTWQNLKRYYKSSLGGLRTQTYPYVEELTVNNKNYSSSTFFGESSIWIWATEKLEEGTGGINGWLSNFFAAGGSFDINFKIKYIPRNLDSTNYFKILYNGYSNTRKCDGYTLPCTNFARWKDLSSFPTNKPAYNQASYPVLFGGYDSNGSIINSTSYNDKLIEQDITLTIDTSKLSDWGLTNGSSIFGTSQDNWSPSLMLGIGSSTQDKHLQEGFIDVNQWTGRTAFLGATTELYEFESGCMRNPTDDTIDFTSSERAYFFKDTYELSPNITDSSNSNYKTPGIDILDLDITFSSSDGNESKLLNNVDYLYNTDAIYTYDKTNKIGKWTDWSKASKVKINFNYDFKDIAAESAIVYSFWRNKTPYGTNTVYGRSSNSTYKLNNTDGFTNANLG